MKTDSPIVEAWVHTRIAFVFITCFTAIPIRTVTMKVWVVVCVQCFCTHPLIGFSNKSL